MTAARQLEEYSHYREETPLPRQRRPKKRSRIPVTVKVCLVAACCVVVGLLYLQQQVTSYYLSMELVQIEEQVNAMQQRNDHLMLSLESQRSLKQIEQIARNELGMVEPTYTATLVLNGPAVMAGEAESRWVAEEETPSGETMGILATLASWMNRVLPLGGVEAGTLHR